MYSAAIYFYQLKIPIKIRFMNKPLQLLNNLTPMQFLAEYWQKKPLLIKKAIPDFTGLMSPNDLAGLACEDDVQARIIKQSKGKWSVQSSPFDETDFTKLPKKDWTLLVQGVNHYLPEAAALLALFNFIPHARLDDLMVSYAPTGGGVGAHVDSYDVFLLQGTGKRRWKISAQTDLSLVENAPLKILKNFVSEQEWLLVAGDMLYLPPQIAHWGVSESDDCMTYSIGFRAPNTQELQHEFLSYLQDNLSTEGLYADPDLQPQNHPAEISDAMINLVRQMLQTIAWDNHTVADFLGQYLTEPKPNVVFEPPRKISIATFNQLLSTKNLLLDLKSQMLFANNRFYLNGEQLAVTLELNACMRELADKRYLKTDTLQPNIHAALGDVLYEPYLAGFINFKK
jgi:50S ribosomal protein L16 3-hydroxylase